MTQQISVLVVDDEELVREALELVLLRAGFEALACESAHHALKYCDERSFDVILTDLVMPDMDGVSLIKALRAKHIKTPVITLTGGARLAQQNLSEQSVEAGASLSLRKPLDKQQLTHAIHEVLEIQT